MYRTDCRLLQYTMNRPNKNKKATQGKLVPSQV